MWTVSSAYCCCVFHVQAEGEDSLKKMQLMELAILNGTYRDANIKSRKNETEAQGYNCCSHFVHKPFSFGSTTHEQLNKEKS